MIRLMEWWIYDQCLNLLIKKLGVPKLTVILYSPSDVIVARLKSRNKNDSDIAKAVNSEKIYSKMIEFCETKQMPYVVIDTSTLTPNEVVDKILQEKID